MYTMGGRLFFHFFFLTPLWRENLIFEKMITYFFRRDVACRRASAPCALVGAGSRAAPRADLRVHINHITTSNPSIIARGRDQLSACSCRSFYSARDQLSARACSCRSFYSASIFFQKFLRNFFSMIRGLSFSLLQN